MPNFTRIHDLLPLIKHQFKRDVLIAGKRNGKWTNYGAQEFLDLVDLTSQGLVARGIQKGERVAIMSSNRPEWNLCDFAIMQIGATQVPMYPTLSDQDIQFIIKDAEIKLVFVGSKELAEKLVKIKESEGLALAIYSFNEQDGVPFWKDLFKDIPSGIDLQPYRDGVLPEDLATLIYTSGTTGTPKGVMLTHNNLVSNLQDTVATYPANMERIISFLPLSHIFERMVSYMNFYVGVSIYYAESLETVMADIQEVKPNGFTTVPRMLEKIYDKIVERGSQLTGIKRMLFYWSLNLGLKYELYGKNGWWYQFQLAIANVLVFGKWRAALGGEVKTLMSGGAALQPRLARVFWAANIQVLEGYGLTETSPVISLNGLGKHEARFGTVGKAIRNVQVKIADDGEILCKGPNIMKGYYKRPDLTAEVIDADGWFHTGDIGELSADGFLRITDRKKEIFKTAGGKYIAPQLIENRFKESNMIEQIMVVGENRKFPSALIVPNFATLKSWCELKEIPFTTKEEVLLLPEVLDKYQREADRLNVIFGKWEQIKKFTLLANEWSIAGGELTPKLSLKRKVILAKHQQAVEKMYTDLENGKI